MLPVKDEAFDKIKPFKSTRPGLGQGPREWKWKGIGFRKARRKRQTSKYSS